MKPILMLFIDGLGLGPADARNNPLAAARPRMLRLFEDESSPLPMEGVCLAADATLGVEGLPQSATGQTTLFTGRNAAELLGHHLPGFPNGPLKDVIAQSSLMLRLAESGCSVSFANTYTDRFFDDPPRWKSVTTVMCQSAGVRLWRVHDMEQHDSVFMDFTNRMLRERGHDMPLQTPRQAGRRLARHAARFDFCLYEYFLTDMVAHRGSFEESVEILRGLEEMVSELLSSLDLDHHSVLLISDHGNIEDASTRTHTRAPVPTAVWGPLRHRLPADENLSLAHITPWLVDRARS